MRRERTIHYFERLSETSFRASNHTGGAWNTEEQHIAPALGLLAHAIETDRDRRRDDRPAIGRACPTTSSAPSRSASWTRPPHTACRAHDRTGRGHTQPRRPARRGGAGLADAVLRDRTVRRHPFPSIAATRRHADVGRDHRLAGWVHRVRRRVAATTSNPDARRSGAHPDPAGRRRAGQRRRPNGRRARHRQRHGHSGQPRRGGVPNLDLTLHLFAEPDGEWVGFDTSVSFAPPGSD